MAEIKTGDRVRFRAGRGFAEGTAANVSAGKVLINTKAGKSLTRKLTEVSRVDAEIEPAPAVETPAGDAPADAY